MDKEDGLRQRLGPSPYTTENHFSFAPKSLFVHNKALFVVWR